MNLFRSKKKKRRTPPKKHKSRLCEFLEARLLLAADFQNPLNAFNVNGDEGGFVSPIDVLHIITELNNPTLTDSITGELPTTGREADQAFLDVDGDGFVSPLDVVAVVNVLNEDHEPPTLLAALANDTAPLGQTNTDGVTSDATIEGLITDNMAGLSSLTASVGGADAVPISFAGDGTFRFDPRDISGEFGDGEHTITLTGIDAKQQEREFELSIVLDTTRPTGTVAATLEAGSDTGEQGDGITSSSYVNLTGTAEPSGAVGVTNGDTQTIVSNEGEFTLYGVPLAIGENTLEVVQFDAAGNEAESTSTVQITREANAGSITMTDAGAFVSEQAVAVNLKHDQSLSTLRLEVDARFAEPDSPNALSDVFSVFLTKKGDRSDTLIDRGVNGTSLFSLIGGVPDFTPGLATFDGSVIEIDTSSLSNLTEAELVFQLIDADGALGSMVSVGPVSNEQSVDRFMFEGSKRYAQAGPALDTTGHGAIDYVSVHYENVRVDSSGEMSVDVSLRNNGETNAGKSVIVTLPGLPEAVTVENASGKTADGTPYVNVAPAISSGGLGKFESSSFVTLSFTNAESTKFQISPSVLSACENKAPQFDAVPSITLTPGAREEITLSATDADGDRISYSVVTGEKLPRLELRGNVLKLLPTPNDIGEYSIEVNANDGAASVSQIIDVSVLEDEATSTRISGVIMNADPNDLKALPNVPLEVVSGELVLGTGDTAGDGTFLIEFDMPSEQAEKELLAIKVHGEAIEGDETYPFIAERLSLLYGHLPFANVNNVVERPIYLPALDVGQGVTIDAEVETIVEATLKEEEAQAKLMVSAGSLLEKGSTDVLYSGDVSITEVPRDLTPAALPANLFPDIVVTIQPGEMEFTDDAELTLPNRAAYPAGTIMNLWSINPVTGDFDDVGDGRVTSDGSSIETVSGGVRSSSWHFFAPPPTNPDDDNDKNPDDACDECKETVPFTSEVELHSGAVIESHDVVTYGGIGEISGIRLVYDSLRADPRPIVHVSYEDFPGVAGGEAAPIKFAANLSFENGANKFAIPGFDASIMGLTNREHFWSLPEDSGGIEVALQGDLRDQPTGEYRYQLNNGFVRFDGESFSGSRVDTTGSVIHVNGIGSSLGNGWGIAGVKRITVVTDGSALLVDGDGSESLYRLGSDGEFQSPVGDFSSLQRDGEGFSLREKNGTVLRFDENGLIKRLEDRNGNATVFHYEQDRLLKIEDPDNEKKTIKFSYQGSRLSTISDSAGRVTELMHDAQGNLASIVDPDDSSRRFEYDSLFHLVAETDKREFREEARYNFAGRATSATRKDGSVVTVSPVQTSVLLPASETASFENAPVVPHRTQATSWVSNSLGNTRSVAMDRRGQSLQENDPLGITTRVRRNESNLVYEVVDSRGFSTGFTYDANGNVSSMTTDLGENTGSAIFPGRQISHSASRSIGTTADFNGDGLQDVILASTQFLPASLEIYLKQPDESFVLSEAVRLRETVLDVTVTDADADGDLDFLVLNEGSGSLSIYLNEGNEFTEQRIEGFFGGAGLGGNVIEYDYNGDVYPDFAVASSINNGVYILIGGADGVTTAGLFPSPASPNKTGMMADDFNSDGFDDLALLSNGRLSVLVRKPNGGFESSRSVSVPRDTPEQSGQYSVRNVTTGDVNSDGRVDLIVSVDVGVAVLLGQDGGGFTDPILTQTFGDISDLLVCDLNADDRLDLATVSFSSGLRHMYGNGNGSFASGDANAPTSTADCSTITTVDGSGATVYGTNHGFVESTQGMPLGELEDINNDGIPDNVYFRPQSTTGQIAFGDGDGAFSNLREIDPSIGASSRHAITSISLFDANNDGLTDIVTGVGDELSILKGVSSFSNDEQAFSSATLHSVGLTPSHIANGDMNNDGFTDVITTNSSSDDLSVLLADQKGSLLPEIRIPVGSKPERTLVGDFNGDGRPDLLVSNGGDRTVSLVVETQPGVFSTVNSFVGGDGELSVGDVNGDGKLDFFGIDLDTSKLVVRTQREDGFDEYELASSVSRTTELAAGDLNQDGFDDLVLSIGNRLSILYGSTNGLLGSEIHYASVGGQRILLDDVNGDGRIDILVGGSDNTRVLIQGKRTDKATSIMEHDPTFGRLVRNVDERGTETLYVVNSENGNTEEIRVVVGDADAGDEGDDVVTKFSYYTNGLIKTETDPRGTVTRYEYDDFERLTKITFAEGKTGEEATQEFRYDAAGNQTVFIDENGNVTESVYDEMNRLIEIIEADPDGVEGPLTSPLTKFKYDEAGNLTETIDAEGVRTANEYDEMGRLVKTIDAESNAVRFVYDEDGNLLEQIDELGRTTRNEYDDRSRLISTTDTGGSVTKFTYDQSDNLASVTDPVGNITRFVYDARDRMILEIDPLGKSTKYTYDAADNLTLKVDRLGRQTKFDYDELNRLTLETWIDADGQTISNEIVYKYDKNSNLLSVSDYVSSLTYTYDFRNRVKTVDNDGTPDAPHAVLTYRYDGNGNVTSVTDVIDTVPGATTSYVYDALNRTTQITQDGNEVSEKRVDFAFNQLGQYSSIDRFSSLAGGTPSVSTSYDYDDLNRLTRLEHSNVDSVLAFYDYSYEENGRIASITDIDGTINYGYDTRDQLETADHPGENRDEEYHYDANGNRTSSHRSEEYTTEGGNRLESDGTYTYEYDAEGNMIRRTEIESGDYREFEWDQRNRLIAIFGSKEESVFSFTYDTRNRRIHKSSSSLGTEEQLHFIYDREDVIVDHLSVGIESLTRYLHGSGIDQVLHQESAAMVGWLTTDQLGSIRELIGSDGVVIASVGYDSFGIRNTTDSLSRYGFSGREFDSDTGMTYSRRRYYDGEIGRFLSEDPILYGGSLNVYAYAGNRPVDVVDLFGMEGQPIDDVLGDLQDLSPEQLAETPMYEILKRLDVDRMTEKEFLDAQERIGEAIKQAQRIAEQRKVNHGQIKRQEAQKCQEECAWECVVCVFWIKNRNGKISWNKLKCAIDAYNCHNFECTPF